MPLDGMDRICRVNNPGEVRSSINKPTGAGVAATMSDLGNVSIVKTNPDFYKEMYKEALNQFRYYGTLRSAIAWPPATIMAAAISLLGKMRDDAPVATAAVKIMYAFLCVLLLILAANCYLQGRQRVELEVAKEAQSRWIKPNEPQILYPRIRADVRKIKYYLRPDPPTILLALFLLTLYQLVGTVLTLSWGLQHFPLEMPSLKNGALAIHFS
jgi:hypothetical protein